MRPRARLARWPEMGADHARALLLILDGAGLDDPKPGNAVTRATLPTWFQAMDEHGFAVLDASGPPVGLDKGQVGNSEVGHLTIGAGFVIPSTLSRIQSAYRDGSWKAQPLWQQPARSNKIHIVGLLSDAGVHGHVESLVQSATLAHEHGIKDIVVHPVLDGVDSQAGTAPALLQTLDHALEGIHGARLGVVMGRRWFCDRSGDLAITRVYAGALTGQSELPPFRSEALDAHLASASEASFKAHAGSPDCFVRPSEPVLLTQHRADRAIQAARVFGQTNAVYSLVELGEAVEAAKVFFPTRPLKGGLGFEFKRHGLKSVRISETCKFPHVTYFLNGLNRDLEGRQTCIDSIPESEIGNCPEMSLTNVCHAIVDALEDPANRVVIANIPNLDQVGHLGKYDTAARAARYVDAALKKILATCQEKGWTAIVTSDHGNADRTIDSVGRPFGSHTERPVPFVVVPAAGITWTLRARDGSLTNVAPTLLAALGLPRPAYMTDSLIAKAPSSFEQTATRGAA
jgi:2,3-bisphosphoglycerate-independent phosphoglycerate mutase